MPDTHLNMLGSIKDREDFLQFMEHWIPTLEDVSVQSYLESVTAWANDMDGYYANTGQESPEHIDWNFIAALLYAGSIYE